MKNIKLLTIVPFLMTIVFTNTSIAQKTVDNNIKSIKAVIVDKYKFPITNKVVYMLPIMIENNESIILIGPNQPSGKSDELGNILIEVDTVSDFMLKYKNNDFCIGIPPFQVSSGLMSCKLSSPGGLKLVKRNGQVVFIKANEIDDKNKKSIDIGTITLE